MMGTERSLGVVEDFPPHTPLDLVGELVALPLSPLSLAICLAIWQRKQWAENFCCLEMVVASAAPMQRT